MHGFRFRAVLGLGPNCRVEGAVHGQGHGRALFDSLGFRVRGSARGFRSRVLAPINTNPVKQCNNM